METTNETHWLTEKQVAAKLNVKEATLQNRRWRRVGLPYSKFMRSVRYKESGSSGTILTSSDGVTWTLRDSGTSNELRGRITYGNGLFVTVGWEGTLLTSSDGISWDNRTSGTTNTLYGVTYKE